MPEHIRGNAKPMECMFENALRNMGFEVVHDGHVNQSLNLGGNPSFFTRVLRAKVDGEFVNTWVKFTYDLRNGHADFSISHRDMLEYERAVAIMDAKKPGVETETETAAEVKEL